VPPTIEQAVKAATSTPEPTPAAPAAPEPPAAPAAPSPDASEEFRRINAADREKWQAQQAAKAAQAELAELKAQVQQWSDDPYAAFEAAGGSMDGFAARVLNDGQPTADDKYARLEKIITKQQEHLEQLDNQRQESQQASYYTDHGAQVRTILDSSDDYQETRDAMDVVGAITGRPVDMALVVRQQIDPHYQQTGLALTPGEVAGMVRKDASGVAERLRASPALRRLMGLPAEPTQQPPPIDPAAPAPSPTQSGPQPTLTGSGETGTQVADLAALPHDERMRQIAANYDQKHSKPGR
jgi:hypothetical protein